jgi:cation-transporting ATPase 13A3/4/5
MASCHSVTYVKEQLLGDPFEIRMFENTGWILDENI